MKKILLTILLTNLILPAFSFEDYIIISKTPVKSVTTENIGVVEAKPVFTIDNKKKLIILTPISTGKGKIIVTTTDGKKEILNVKIADKKTDIKPHEGFRYFRISPPPEGIEIPKPPAAIDIPQPLRGNG